LVLILFPSLAIIVYMQWPLQIPVINYPEFCNLDHLNFTLPCFNSNILVNVLEKCHELMVLIIHCHKVCTHFSCLLESIFGLSMYACTYQSVNHKYIFESSCSMLLVGGTIIFTNMGATINNCSYMSYIPPEVYLHRRISGI